MKAYLSFNLNNQDDKEAYAHALKGAEYALRIEEFGNVLRSLYKHDGFEDIKAVDGMVNIEELRTAYWAIMRGVEE